MSARARQSAQSARERVFASDGPSLWYDLSRDWQRWSGAERAAAGTAAIALALLPPLFVVVTHLCRLV